jgi:GT2 family glycosyltransferase
MNLSVVIPAFNHWHLTHQLLTDLFTYCSQDITEVVVVDDCSTERDVPEGLTWWKYSSPLPLKTLTLPKNVGFLLAANEGMALASGDTLVLISNDVRVGGRFTSRVIDLLAENPNIILGGTLYNMDVGWNRFGDKVFPYLEGWLLAMTHEAWDDIGGFNEQFAPNDYEDIDFSASAREKGHNLVSLNDPNLRHLCAQSIGYSAERQALTERNREKFRDKWLKSV